MDRVQTALRQYLLNTGGSIFKFFQSIDKNGDNYLSAEELLEGLKQLGVKDFKIADMKAVTAILDENKDGKVSYIEFAKLLKHF